jgi:hypothetical protein
LEHRHGTRTCAAYDTVRQIRRVRSVEHIFDLTAWLAKLALISSEEAGNGEQAAGSGQRAVLARGV